MEFEKFDKLSRNWYKNVLISIWDDQLSNLASWSQTPRANVSGLNSKTNEF